MPPIRTRRSYVGRALRRAGAAGIAAGTYLAGGGLVPGYNLGRMAYRAMGGGRRLNAAGKGVTANFDAKTVYRRKRMPKRKRKIWKKFVRKVKAAISDRGTCQFVMNGSNSYLVDAATAGINRQMVQCVHLYGKNGFGHNADEIGASDLQQITADLLASSDPGVDDTTKFQVKSAVLDVTVTNETLPGATYEGSLEVDVYHIVYPGKKQNVAVGLKPVFQLAYNETEIITVGGARVEIEDRGATPFNLGQAMSLTGLKIVNKKKYFLGKGQSFTYQIRDPKNRIANIAEINDKQTFYKNGWTQTLMIIAKPLASVAVEDTFSLLTGATRTFNVDFEGLNEDKSKYYNNFI